MKNACLILILLIGFGRITYSQTVKIGTQVWMTNNLNVYTFRNGDLIPHAETIEEWIIAAKSKQPAWCYYDNKSWNGTKYGKLYNWYAVTDPRGLAPLGYHIPTNTEWETMERFLGHEVGKKLKSVNGWDNYMSEGSIKEKLSGNGSNASGFSGIPGGTRSYNGHFNFIGTDSYFWSSSEYDTEFAWFLWLFNERDYDGRLYHNKGDGLSVRCIKD